MEGKAHAQVVAKWRTSYVFTEGRIGEHATWAVSLTLHKHVSKNTYICVTGREPLRWYRFFRLLWSPGRAYVPDGLLAERSPVSVLVKRISVGLLAEHIAIGPLEKRILIGLLFNKGHFSRAILQHNISNQILRILRSLLPFWYLLFHL